MAVLSDTHDGQPEVNRAMNSFPVLLFLMLTAIFTYASDDVDEDAFLDTIGLLEKYGYPAERHYVETEDGYILQLHRVPSSPLSRDGEERRRPPVLVMHGILCSSADWVLMGPGKGFGYILADAGYDVWLGNARGNTYSRNHTYLKPTDTKFWKFSWHEMGVYDLPAVIDYILYHTGHRKLFYAGFSMGTTMFFVMCSERPSYNDKIRAMFALAPVAYMGHLTSPFFRLPSLIEKPLEDLSELLGPKELLPSNEIITHVGQTLCRNVSPFQFLCSNIIFLFGGYDSVELNTTMLPVIVGHTPAGTSTRAYLHYVQEVNSFKFQKYDFGLRGNMPRYNQARPPQYDLGRVTAPVALHYSYNDWVVAVRDVNRLFDELANPIGKFPVEHYMFNHLDFLWAIHAKELVYDTVINLMDKY